MNDKILVTGGCGFIGSNFIDFISEFHSSYRVANIDSLTYAGNLRNLDNIGDLEYTFYPINICDIKSLDNAFEEFKPDYVVNFAAETHVDRSIEKPQVFFETNVGGTLSLLRLSLKHGVKRYLQISTDEVYGSLGPSGYFTEKTQLAPNSPYSASKASADHFVRSYHHTYNLDTVITRCSNNYGNYQFPEKLIPLMINNARNDKSLPVYGSGLNVRDWIHVKDHCAAVWSVLTKGRPGEVYNIGGSCEKTNIDIVRQILNIMNKPESLIKFVKDRPGHDFRYAIDSTKAQKELGWIPSIDFTTGLKETINWYMQNEGHFSKAP